MEELKQLVEMVTNLPSLTVWVLAGYLMYRLAVISSMYATIRLCIIKWHDYKTKPVDYKIGKITLGDNVPELLLSQIIRLANGTYIASSDVAKLSQALDIVLAKK